MTNLCDTFSLQNKKAGNKTCFKKLQLHLQTNFLTNRPSSFYKTGIFKTGLSDQHKLILSFFHSYFTRIPPKTLQYSNYKTLSETTFYMSLVKNILKGECLFTKTFREVLDKHAPLKSRKIRRNRRPFKTKELSKVLMNKKNTRNKLFKCRSRENFLDMKRAKITVTT